MSVIEIVAGALLIVASLVIILVVLAQDTKEQGLTSAIGGGYNDSFYEKPEITNADIKELFGTGETQTIKIKKAVKEEMAKRGVKSWLPHSVNTEIAYEVWGIDIDNFEKRLKKLRTLYGKDVRK